MASYNRGRWPPCGGLSMSPSRFLVSVENRPFYTSPCHRTTSHDFLIAVPRMSTCVQWGGSWFLSCCNLNAAAVVPLPCPSLSILNLTLRLLQCTSIHSIRKDAVELINQLIFIQEASKELETEHHPSQFSTLANSICHVCFRIPIFRSRYWTAITQFAEVRWNRTVINVDDGGVSNSIRV